MNEKAESQSNRPKKMKEPWQTSVLIFLLVIRFLFSGVLVIATFQRLIISSEWAQLGLYIFFTLFSGLAILFIAIWKKRIGWLFGWGLSIIYLCDGLFTKDLLAFALGIFCAYCTAALETRQYFGIGNK